MGTKWFVEVYRRYDGMQRYVGCIDEEGNLTTDFDMVKFFDTEIDARVYGAKVLPEFEGWDAGEVEFSFCEVQQEDWYED